MTRTFALFTFACITTLNPASSFMLADSLGSSTLPNNRRSSLILRNDLFEDIHEPVPEEHIPAVELADKTGAKFKVGSIIRVTSDRVKAFHVSTKGRGAFNDDKEFVPDADGKFLLLPVGLRGVISRIYDQTEISANFPIVVKFVKGENTEEGYDAPVTFVMHLESYEVECAE